MNTLPMENQSLRFSQFFQSFFRMADRREASPLKNLWNTHDPRIDVALFQSNVPTLIINQEQRFLDWNTAFEMAFSEIGILKKGTPISTWYEHLDNFRNISKRIERLYGEGVLPITDRERVTFISKKFGRMVFTKIMSPILDRLNGKIIGWTIVLNINSVAKRSAFFEELYQRIEEREKFIRFTSSYDQVFQHSSAHQELLQFHVENLQNSHRILEFGSLMGDTTSRFLALKKKVYSLALQPEILRKAHEKSVRFLAALKLVKRSYDRVDDIPVEKFDGLSIALSVQDFTDFEAALCKLLPRLNKGTIIVLSTWTLKTDIDEFIRDVRSELTAKNRISELKYFFNHVINFLKNDFSEKKSQLLSEDRIAGIFLHHGLTITHQSHGYLNGHALGIVAKV